MHNNDELCGWIASIERGDCGYTFVRLYNDAPAWVRNATVNRFGKGTVFLPARQNRAVSKQAA